MRIIKHTNIDAKLKTLDKTTTKRNSPKKTDLKEVKLLDYKTFSKRKNF